MIYYGEIWQNLIIGSALFYCTNLSEGRRTYERDPDCGHPAWLRDQAVGSNRRRVTGKQRDKGK